jgi:predicted nucleotidyltransferase component of viral defense system
LTTDTLKRHEIFEIELLDTLKSGRFLEPLVFGGGTMLRLCHELNRYSSDLDFWFIKKTDQKAYFTRLKDLLGKKYEVTDATVKFYTMLFEVRSGVYPKRLKIEIRKEVKECEHEERIAFSRYTTGQIALKVHTLEQTMKNKIAAALDRKNVRDYFDIEFLLRRGVPAICTPEQGGELRRIALKFTDKDFSVTLGAFLDAEDRSYYRKQRFSYLCEKLQSPRK